MNTASYSICFSPKVVRARQKQSWTLCLSSLHLLFLGSNLIALSNSAVLRLLLLLFLKKLPYFYLPEHMDCSQKSEGLGWGGWCLERIMLLIICSLSSVKYTCRVVPRKPILNIRLGSKVGQKVRENNQELPVAFAPGISEETRTKGCFWDPVWQQEGLLGTRRSPNGKVHVIMSLPVLPGEDSGGRSYTPSSLGTSFVLLFSLKTSFKLFLSGLSH